MSLPRFDEALLSALGAGDALRDAVLGDLAEEYAERTAAGGAEAARRMGRLLVMIDERRPLLAALLFALLWGAGLAIGGTLDGHVPLWLRVALPLTVMAGSVIGCLAGLRHASPVARAPAA